MTDDRTHLEAEIRRLQRESPALGTSAHLEQQRKVEQLQRKLRQLPPARDMERPPRFKS